MLIGTTKTRIVGTAVLALSAAALLAPTASGKPTPRVDEHPNLLGSQLDRIVQPPADSLEGALRATEAESSLALRAVYSDLVQPRNELGSRFDRLSPVSAENVIVPQPDAFERAVAIRQAEIAARSARSNRHQPTSQPSITGDGGSSFDWGLVGALSAMAAACLVLGGATLVLARQRHPTAHP